MTDMNEPLFSSAHAALTFAFNFSGQQFDKSAMARLASTASHTGKGLGGLDGAAQAGMIKQELAQLGKLAEAVLIARIAPQSHPCACRTACCSGWQINKVWRNATAVLAEQMRTTALTGTSANALMRFACVVRCFTEKEQKRSLDSLAKELQVNRQTMGAHAGKVAKAIKELEYQSMNILENRLRDIGMVG